MKTIQIDNLFNLFKFYLIKSFVPFLQFKYE